MDPDAALQELRDLLDPRHPRPFTPAESDRIGELFAALDEWLSSGGFLPSPWAR